MRRLFAFLQRQRLPIGEADATLLERFRLHREELAFQELLRRHGPLVWGICRRGLANPLDAEDAFQAVFVVLIRRAGRIDAGTPLGPWLCRTAVWTVNNLRRRNQHRRSAELPTEHAATEVSGHYELYEMLAELPEKYRSAIVLCHLQGWSRREAAVELGIPEGTLSANLNRGLNRLKARFTTDPVPPLAVLAVATLPGSLQSQTFQSVTAYLISAGLSPTILELSQGVLRMFWIKKAIAGLMLSAGLTVGVIGWSLTPGGNAAMAQADDKKAENRDEENLKMLRDAERAAEARLKVTEAIYEKEKAEAKRASEIYRLAVQATTELRALEAERQQAADDRIEITAADNQGWAGNYSYAEYKNGKRQLYAVLGYPEDMTVLLKRCLADPNAPKKIVVNTEGLHPKGPPKTDEMDADLAFIEAIRLGGVKTVYFNGYVTSIVQYPHQRGDGKVNMIPFFTQPVLKRSKKFIDLTELFPGCEKYYNHKEKPFEDIYSYSKQVSIFVAIPDNKNRIQISHTAEAKLKVGNVLPVYSRVMKSGERTLKTEAYLKIVEIKDGTAWAEDVTKEIDSSIKQPFIHEAFWLGFPMKK
ncbi:MAG: sigma-70 family RNA polymerase sigma factor [Fimbriiglobus sp.]